MDKFGFEYEYSKKTHGFGLYATSKSMSVKFRSSSGIQYVFKFDNGYGASVIKTPGVSYGWENDKWELAVLYEGSITNDTPITTDVLGYLTDEGVHNTLEQIQKLPKK